MDYIHIADRVEQINYWIGLGVNLLLVYLILHNTRAELGSYKYLQLAFVLNDVAYGSCSYILQNKIITNGHTMALFMASQFGDNLHLACMDAAMFSLILVIVAFNFLYRYWAVVTPQHIQLFSTVCFPLLLAFIALCEFAVWYTDCFFLFAATNAARADLVAIFARKYGIDAMNYAMIVGDYWRDGSYNVRPILGLLIFSGIIGAGFAFMNEDLWAMQVFCSLSILRHLSQTKAISAKTRKLQYALFRMLAVQTVIPFLFVHTATGQVLVLPAFGITFGVLGDWCSMLVSFFPPLDAIAVILLMRDYREAVAKVVLCRIIISKASKTSSVITVPTSK